MAPNGALPPVIETLQPCVTVLSCISLAQRAWAPTLGHVMKVKNVGLKVDAKNGQHKDLSNVDEAMCGQGSLTHMGSEGKPVSIRRGPQSNGRRWPGLMKHIFFDVDVDVCVAYLGNTWHQDALWEEGKPAEAV